MYPYFASQDTLLSRALLIRFVQPLGQVRAREKVSCIQCKTCQGNFWSARKEVCCIQDTLSYGVREGALRRKYMLFKKIYTFSKKICFLERIYLRKNIYFS